MNLDFLNETSHRSWPLDTRPWIMRMRWEQLAFLHWRVDADVIRQHVPAGLEVDTFDGSAWLGVVPFLMSNVGARGLPCVPGTDRFPELNLRTYVTRNGRPGVWFFSLDAANWLAVRGARSAFYLPYFDARMSIEAGESIQYQSERTHRGATPGKFRAEYRPAGAGFLSKPGSLELWLTERYCLYSSAAGSIYRGEIHHRPWPLQPAEVTVRENTLGDLIGADLSAPPESVLFARSLDVVAWWLVRD